MVAEYANEEIRVFVVRVQLRLDNRQIIGFLPTRISLLLGQLFCVFELFVTTPMNSIEFLLIILTRLLILQLLLL